MTHLIEHAAEYFDIDPRAIVGKGRRADILIARDCCAYVMRKRFKMNYPMIGKVLNRDHSTVIYAVEKVWHRYDRDPELAAAIEHLMEAECTRFLPAWHESAKGKNVNRTTWDIPPPNRGPGKAQPPHSPAKLALAIKARNDFDTGDDPQSYEAVFRTGIRRGSDALLAALRAA